MLDVGCLMLDFGFSLKYFNQKITVTICPILRK